MDLNEKEQKAIDERRCTFKVLADLCMYYDFIEELYEHYDCTSFTELRARLLN